MKWKGSGGLARGSRACGSAKLPGDVQVAGLQMAPETDGAKEYFLSPDAKWCGVGGWKVLKAS